MPDDVNCHRSPVRQTDLCVHWQIHSIFREAIQGMHAARQRRLAYGPLG